MTTTTPPPPTAPSSSTRLVTTQGPVVVGDGTTAAGRARSRWRRLRGPLLVVVVLVVSGVLASLLRPQTSATGLAPDNPGPMGSRALAQILEAQGVDITYVRTSGEALEAADEGSTLLVTGTYLLTPEQVEDLAATPADLVVVEPEGWDVATLTGSAVSDVYGEGEGDRPAACDDPDARAARTIESGGFGFVSSDPAVEVCFPTDDGSRAGAYAALQEPDGRRVVLLDENLLMTNERLAEDGNAALMLRALGHNEDLVWYVPSLTDTGGAVTGPALADVTPRWFGPVALLGLLLVLALAVWRGRRLGRVVTEPLPVVVRAAEATVGRGRLYRRTRSRGHAAAALRAGTARRAAARLGLPRTAGAPEVIDALARATGRPTEQVADLLYGPPPTDDAGLLALARQLDDFESEVHRT